MRKDGFTLVELMIVIAIIGILAGALFPTISNYLARGRDTKRIHDIRIITVGLDNFYIGQDKYPRSSVGTFANVEPNGAWANSSHSGSWIELHARVKEYIPVLPVDPINKQGPGTTGGWDSGAYYMYSYFSLPNYCDSRSAYSLVYSMERNKPVDIKTPEYCSGFTNYIRPDGLTLITTGKVQ